MPLTDTNDISEEFGFPGQIIETDLCHATSGQAEGDVIVGSAVAAGANPKTYKMPVPGDEIVGFAVLPRGQVQRSVNYGQDAEGRYVIPDGQGIAILDFGKLLVAVEGTPADKAPVFIRTDVDGANDLVGGTVATTGGPGVEATALAGARFELPVRNGLVTVRYRQV